MTLLFTTEVSNSVLSTQTASKLGKVKLWAVFDPVRELGPVSVPTRKSDILQLLTDHREQTVYKETELFVGQPAEVARPSGWQHRPRRTSAADVRAGPSTCARCTPFGLIG
jgi:hypothetical protein